MRKKDFNLRIMQKLRPKGYRTTDKIYKMTWDFHKGDPDSSPSVPHGHSMNRKFKLKLWSGEVFNVQTNKQVGIANKKEMIRLYHSNKFKNFVNDAREWFKQNNSYIPELVIPDEFINSKRIFVEKTIRCIKIGYFSVELRVKLQQPQVGS